MSTRSNIAIKLNEEDINKYAFFKNDKLPKCMQYTSEHDLSNINNNIYKIFVSSPYLMIYCHWDGYPEGVGAALAEHFKTHEDTLNLILGGDISSLYGNKVQHYLIFRGDESDIKYSAPRQYNEEPEVEQEWLYLFKDGQWLCKHYSDTEWHSLDEYLSSSEMNNRCTD